MDTLGESLPQEINRVNKLIEMYRDPILNGMGFFAANMMAQSVKEATNAIMDGDIAKMISCYNDLKEYTE